MTIKEVMLTSATFLQLDETYKVIESGKVDGDEESELLLRCVNLVVSEIANEYYPLKEKSVVEANGNGEIFYEDFPKTPYDIYKVVNESGISVPFTRYHDRLIVPRVGKYEIYYSFVPAFLSLSDELPFPEKVDARVVAYGVACEYCLISGMTEDAVVWDKRYKNALTVASFPYGEKRVKTRRWLL